MTKQEGTLVMTYQECQRVMDAISVVADTRMSGVDLDNQIGIIDWMLGRIKESQDKKYGWKPKEDK